MLIVQKLYKSYGINWKWIPIEAPHFNGYCEGYLGMLKTFMEALNAIDKVFIAEAMQASAPCKLIPNL